MPVQPNFISTSLPFKISAIPDATATRAGVMTPEQVRRLGSGGALKDLSVNDAAVDFFPEGYAVLRTGSVNNGAGAFTGGGVGNKAILGITGFDGLSINKLKSIVVVWENVVGPAGPFYNPSSPSVCAPYVNLIVDFTPTMGGNIRVLPLFSAAADGPIAQATGRYSNPGGANQLIYEWDSTLDVQIVNSPPLPVPGGVLPDVDLGGPSWTSKAYKWSALVAANGDATLKHAKLEDSFPDDGGLPAGAVVPAIIINSSDSATAVKQGKRLLSVAINGVSVLV